MCCRSRKTIAILLILICLFSQAFAQNSIGPAFYELKQLYTTYKNDTLYINHLIDKANTFETSDSTVTMQLQALQFSKAIGYKDGIVKSLIDAAVAEENSDKSLAFSWEAMTFINKYFPNDTITDRLRDLIYYNIAEQYFRKNQYGISAYYNYKVIAHTAEFAPTSKQLKMFDNQTKKFVSSNLRAVFGAYCNLGVIWSRSNDPTKSLYYFNFAEGIARAYKDTFFLSHAWNAMAVFYHDENRINQSKSYCYKVLALHNVDESNKQNAKLILSDDLIFEGNYTQAILNIKDILQNNWVKSQRLFQINTYYDMGRAYAGKRDYKQAEYYLSSGLQMADSANYADCKQFVIPLLANIYSITGRYKLGYEYEKQYVLFKDRSIANDQKLIHDLETANQIVRKDQELAQTQLTVVQQKNKINKRNLWIAGISTFTLLLGAIFAFLYKNFIHKQNVLRKEQEIGELKARMNGEEAERSRIARELHDGIISQLSAVKMNFHILPEQDSKLFDMMDYQEAMTQLEESIKELRITAHNLMPEILLLGGLLEAVHIFCEKISKSSDVFIEFQTYGVISPLEQNFELSIYRIVQELVHNIIKHANASIGLVQISCKDELLTVTVEDNGSGIDPNKIRDGIGMVNLKERVKILNGYLDINTGSSGTAIYLEFDITKHKKNEQHAHKVSDGR